MTITKVIFYLQNVNEERIDLFIKSLKGNPNVCDVIVYQDESKDVIAFDKELEQLYI